MILFDGAVTIPLATEVDCSRAVRTIKRLRIPALTEVTFPARPPSPNPGPITNKNIVPKAMYGTKQESAVSMSVLSCVDSNHSS